MTRFDWDDEKDRSNQTKHGISFKRALSAFEDPNQVSYQDCFTDDEQRWHTLGLVDGVLLLLVVHTIQEENLNDELVRVISARRANPTERKTYEVENGTIHP